MISLRLFLILIATLVAREYGGSLPQIGFADSAISVMGLVFGCGLLCKFSALAVLRRAISRDAISHHAGKHPSVMERFGAIRRGIESLWAILLPVWLLATDWVAWSNCLAQAGCPNVLAMGLLFLPTGLLILLMEMSAAQLEELVLESGTSVEVASEQTLNWMELWKLRLRLGEFANFLMGLIPVLLIAGCSDLFTVTASGLNDVQLALVSTLFALSILVLLYPLWIGRWMGVEALQHGDLSQQIDSFQKSLRIARLETVVVPSHGRWNGAAIVGWLPYLRQLWLGDGLIRQLNERQLEMVILHEMAHAKRMHFLWRSLPMVWAVGVGLAYNLLANQFSGGGLLPFWIGQGVSLTLAGLILVVGLGHVARQCELDADRQACRMAAKVCPWAQGSVAQPAIALASALTSLLGSSPASRKRTWLHPSLRERLRALAAEVADGRLTNREPIIQAADG